MSNTPSRSTPAPRNTIPNARFVLKTPPIVEALEDFLTLVEFRDTGGFLVAPQRWGKTRAARYLCASLAATFGPIPFVNVPLRSSMQKGPTAFYSFLLSQANYRHAKAKGRDDDDLRNLFTELVATRAKRSRHKMFVLVIDEAQELTPEQWGFLFNISNEVDTFRVNLVVLLVGQPGLQDAVAKLLTANHEEIVERFLLRQLRFRGLTSASELKFVLQALDELKLPNGDGRPYLSNWCPLAFDGGWRLANQADRLWEEFSQLYEKAGLKVVELPMTYVMNSVNRLLRDISKVDSRTLILPVDAHSRCVGGSGIATSIGSAKRRRSKTRGGQASGEGAE